MLLTKANHYFFSFVYLGGITDTDLTLIIVLYKGDLMVDKKSGGEGEGLFLTTQHIHYISQ